MADEQAVAPIPLKPEPGQYVTDGTGLWRFEMHLPDGEGVIVEDARTGTKVGWALDEFSEMGLRVVDPEGSCEGDSADSPASVAG